MTSLIDQRESVVARSASITTVLQTIGFSVASGGALATLAMVVCIPYMFDGSIGNGVFIALIIGLTCGLGCAPVLVRQGWGRDETIFLPACTWMAAVAVAMVSFTPYRHDLIRGAGIVCGVFVLSAVLMRIRLPRIWRGDGVCRGCGYDVRESMEIGRCPECGLPIDLIPWYAKLPDGVWPRRFARARIFLFRHPIVIICLIVCICLFRFAASQLRSSTKSS